MLVCLNLEFLSYFVNDVESVVLLGGFLLAAYGMLRLLKARPSRAALLGCVATLVLTFIYLKRYEFLDFLIPNSELFVIEDGGHLFLLSHAQESIAAIVEFLDRPAAEARQAA